MFLFERSQFTEISFTSKLKNSIDFNHETTYCDREENAVLFTTFTASVETTIYNYHQGVESKTNLFWFFNSRKLL